MLVAFLWLTVGTSFLLVAQQKQGKNKISSTTGDKKSEKTTAPFENATEEKTETTPTTFSEEYLTEENDHFLSTEIPLQHNKFHDERLFVNFFGDCQAQPPENSCS